MTTKSESGDERVSIRESFRREEEEEEEEERRDAGEKEDEMEKEEEEKEHHEDTQSRRSLSIRGSIKEEDDFGITSEHDEDGKGQRLREKLGEDQVIAQSVETGWFIPGEINIFLAKRH